MLSDRHARVAAVAVVALALGAAACSGSGAAGSGPSGSGAGGSGSSGSGASGSAPRAYTLGDDDVTVANGHTFTVALPVTSGTGYTWEAQSNADLQQVGNETVPGARRPGAASTQRLTFRAQATGGGTQQTTLELGDVRPWEDGVPPVKTATFSVKITS